MALILPDLWLLRHGQTEWNAAQRLQGREDSPLTAQGRAQAERQRARLAGVAARRVASPQGRAQESARIVFGPDFATDARLAEIDIGDWSGLVYDDLRARHAPLFAGGRLDWYDHAPGGEGFARLEARCRDFLSDLTGPTIAVTHGITLRMLRALALGEDLHAAPSFPQDAVHLIRGGRASLLP